MPQTVAFTVNGRAVNVAALHDDTPLLDVLRNQLPLSGTRFGCGLEQCGCCIVLIDGKPVKSCGRAIASVAGRSVTTVEGLGTPEKPHPLQQAFIDEFAFQCGYCTPGMIMSAKALLDENPKPARDEIIHHMDGNICRCTGYVPIVAAIQRAAEVMAKETKK